MLMPSLRLMLELLPPTVDMPPTVLLSPPTDALVLTVLATLLPLPPTLLPATAASMADTTCIRGKPMPDLPVPTIPAVPPATSTEALRAPEDSTVVPSMAEDTACTRKTE